MPNSFGTQAALRVGSQDYLIHRLPALREKFPEAARLPFAMNILLENLLRTEDGQNVKAEDIEALAKWDPQAAPSKEIAFTPSRVLLQDFTGVPAVVDLAAMRDAMQTMGGEPKKINPLQPVELVIDHSVQVDEFGTSQAFEANAALEFQRNRERYLFLRWGQKAFANFEVVPPDTGIVHQVNLEYLARVVFVNRANPQAGVWAYPDTVVGTDSHTTMINGLGVLGWGVGGIEAEAAMLGQPMSMLLPQVVGFQLTGKLPEGATATDLVLTVTEMLRKKGVVGKFVEFFGEGLAELPLADRATIANMAPEYGATCGIFPVDEETLRYLRFTGRSEEQVNLVEAYYKEQGLFHTKDTPAAAYSDVMSLDLKTVEPCLAGPSRPQDRVALGKVKQNFTEALPKLVKKVASGQGPVAGEKGAARGQLPLAPERTEPAAASSPDTGHWTLDTGSVVIAAITSCTNTSNPSVMLAAGLLAQKAVAKGLRRKPWVKTSLSPGSKVVTDYLIEAGVMRSLETLGFFLAGYGCMSCIGNSGPLPETISHAINERELVVASVLSGNRNFEGRVHPEVRANYLASPPLAVAYALTGRIDLDLTTEPLGTGSDGQPVYLKDIWPTQQEVSAALERGLRSEMFRKVYGAVYQGDERWQTLPVPAGDLFTWVPDSTYVRHPPYFENMPKQPEGVKDIRNARVLAVLGDSITTDHISPAGSIKKDGPAGKYLIANGVEPKDFNSYGARRGNHEVMVRGTFANVRLKNLLAPGTEGGVTRHLPDGKPMSIYEAAVQYEKEKVPLVILAGKEYGSGSSRDWAAKGPRLLGVRAVIAESYERIHRSNLVGMGVLPLQYKPGDTAASLGLTGEEVYTIEGLAGIMKRGFRAGWEVMVKAVPKKGDPKEFRALVRIDTPGETDYYRHGGILQFVLRQLLA
jgi:aconitate hydratase